MKSLAHETHVFPWVPLPFKVQLERRVTPEVPRGFYVEPGTDRRLVGVTTFLGHTQDQADKDGLEAWRQKVGSVEADRISRQAAGRGTALHKKCEKWLNNEGVIITGDLSADYDFHALAGKIADGIDAVRGTELALYSKKLGLVGFVDALVIWKGKLAIIDFKTSTKYKHREWVEGYFLQCAIYAFMVYELYGEMPETLVLPIFTSNDISVVYEANISEFLPSLKQRLDLWARIKDAIL